MGFYLFPHISDTELTIHLFLYSIIVPNSDDILLYGGRRIGTDLPVTDYIYRFNSESNQWTEINLSQAGAGPRWGHSGKFYIQV